MGFVKVLAFSWNGLNTVLDFHIVFLCLEPYVVCFLSYRGLIWWPNKTPLEDRFLGTIVFCLSDIFAANCWLRSYYN